MLRSVKLAIFRPGVPPYMGQGEPASEAGGGVWADTLTEEIITAMARDAMRNIVDCFRDGAMCRRIIAKRGEHAKRILFNTRPDPPE